MAIILEGFDGAGKSTLASKLKFPVLHAGGPPKNNDQLKANLSEQLVSCSGRVILDRVTALSHQIYGGLYGDPRLEFYIRAMLDMPKTVLVYCRPPDHVLLNFSKHEVKAHDTPEHLLNIEANARAYINLYDELMLKYSHIRYDYTTQNEDIALINGLIYSQIKS